MASGTAHGTKQGSQSSDSEEEKNKPQAKVTPSEVVPDVLQAILLAVADERTLKTENVLETIAGEIKYSLTCYFLPTYYSRC